MNILQLSTVIGLLKSYKIVNLVCNESDFANVQIDITLENFTKFSLPPFTFDRSPLTNLIRQYNTLINDTKLNTAQEGLINILCILEQLYYKNNVNLYNEPWFNESELDFIRY